jgi:hypothetical protein
VPLGYWPIIVETDIDQPGAAGIHMDKDNQPFSLVQYSSTWSLTASHEALEMLADPFGNRVIPGESVMDGQGRVEYLVEVCDPCEAWKYGYNVNGVRVSDFYTPDYFDPVGSSGARYDFMSHIKSPRQVLDDGYLSWHDLVTDHWFQLTRFGVQDFRDLGTMSGEQGSLRSQIDASTGSYSPLLKGFGETDPRLATAAGLTLSHQRSTDSKATFWRAQIAGIKRAYPVRSQKKRGQNARR